MLLASVCIRRGKGHRPAHAAESIRRRICARGTRLGDGGLQSVVQGGREILRRNQETSQNDLLFRYGQACWRRVLRGGCHISFTWRFKGSGPFGRCCFWPNLSEEEFLSKDDRRRPG